MMRILQKRQRFVISNSLGFGAEIVLCSNRVQLLVGENSCKLALVPDIQLTKNGIASADVPCWCARHTPDIRLPRSRS